MTKLDHEEVPILNLIAFKPLSSKLWICTLTMTLFISFLLVWTEQQEGSGENYSWVNSVTYLVGMLLQRDIAGQDPYSPGTRIICIGFASFMVVWMSTYTAVLTANKVTGTYKLLIDGFNDPKILNPTYEFTFGTLADSSFTQMFKESDDRNWNKMYHFMKPHNFYETEKPFKTYKKEV